MQRPTIGQATAQRNMNTLYQNAHSSVRGAPAVLQYLDVFVAVFGAIVALILGAPALGVVVGAAGWLLQRVVQILDRRFTARMRDPRRQVGIHVTEAFGRIWLLAGAIVVAAAAGDRKDGLAAALVIAAYSVAFAVRITNGPPPEREVRA
jgi:hypothetical protein